MNDSSENIGYSLRWLKTTDSDVRCMHIYDINMPTPPTSNKQQCNSLLCQQSAWSTANENQEKSTGHEHSKVKVKGRPIVDGTYPHDTATECHLPYGITQCYLPPDQTQVWHPCQTGRYSIDLPRRDGRLSWPRWLVTYRDGLPARPSKY